ncbi:hotdog fold thioesterase [Isoptericola luteus]|uniref:hotdog fold thioesterase n=1 Tax=Isoptericola luteus TaxID=2879484 RepID=UPI003BF610D0
MTDTPGPERPTASPAQRFPRTDDEWRAAARGTLIERLGIQLTHVAPERATGSMPVEGNTQPAGLLHGGASVTLAETLGSIAAQLHAGTDRAAVGLEVNATHHRGVRSGSVHGVATALHLGRTTAAYEIVVTDDDGRRVCTARLTCMILAA